MKKTFALLRSRLTLVIAATVALGLTCAAQAATNISDAWGTNTHINNTNCSSPYDTLQLNATRTPADGTPPFNGNLIQAMSDVTYWYPFNNCWESTTWTSNGTGRKAAKVSGVFQNPNPTSAADLYLPTDRFIKLRNLTIDNVDLDYDNTALWFFTSGVTPAPDLALTLNHGSITGLNPPLFDSRARFNLSATGDSTISNWWTKINVQNTTTMNITGADSKLTFFRVGNIRGQYQDALYFYGAGNTALIDGATLKLDQSSMTFGRPSVADGQMTFQNGATLELVNESTKLESGNVSFINSSLKLGLGVTKLTVDNTLTFNGASVDIADSAARLTTAVLDVFASNTIALPNEYSATNYSVTAGVVVMEPDSSLTLNGQGSLASDFQLRWSNAPSGHYGQIVINDNASLLNNGGSFTIIPGAPITINRTSGNVFGSLIVKNSGVTELRGATGFANFSNHGEVSAYAAGAIVVPSGTCTIMGGSLGVISIGDAGRLQIGNFGTALGASALLTTDNQVELDNFSALQLTLDPTARTNSQLRSSSTLFIGNFAELNLALVNDQLLPVGTKFVLIDYAVLSGSGGVAGVANRYFNGYRDGSSFVLGLNRYRINYRDSADAGYGGAVTLTVTPLVPPVATLSPTPQTISGTVGAGLTPSATMMPSNFGGTVTYSINPALPAGIKFDLVKGVISGTSGEALASTVFTIRGIGSTSGDANATVNLTIAKASQSITFGPASAPTYAPGGVFLVSASASSALPVAYSSLTPLVCGAGSGSVTILSAGTCTVAANQTGDANYNAATQATQNIAIARAAQAPLTLIGVPTNINVSATSTLSTSGGSGTGAISYAVSPTSASICSLSGTALTGLATGTCTVTATQAADANYNAIASSPLNIQVGAGAQAQLFLSASPTSLSVNGTSALSTNGGSGTGAVSYAVNNGPCVVAPGSSTVTGTAAGQCQIVATRAADANYGATTSNPVTLTVNLLTPTALVLSASPTSVGFGGSSTLSTSGGISGGAVTYGVTGPCYVTGNSLTGTRVGTCAVTATQAATSVYSAPISNTVTVAVKERTTTFSYPAATAIIGQPFTLTPITAGFTNPAFALFYGSLPAGLTLNPQTGTISGTPTGPLGMLDAVISVYENNSYDAALAVINVQTVPTAVPALSEWALIFLSGLIALLVFARMGQLNRAFVTRRDR